MRASASPSFWSGIGRGAGAPRAGRQPAVRAHAAGDRLRPPLGTRRGCPSLRRRREPLSRLARRVRDVQRRTQQPAGEGGSPGSARARHARKARARRQPAGRDPCRRAVAASALEPRPRALLELRHGSDRGGDQDRPRSDGPLARRLRRARLSRADARRPLCVRRPAFTDRFQPLLPGFSRVPFCDLDALEAACAPRTWRCSSSSPGRPRRLPACAGLSRGCPGAVSPLRHALLHRRGADRLGRTGKFLRSSIGASSRMSSRREVALRRLRAGGSDTFRAEGLRRRLRLAGALAEPRLDVPAQRSRDGRRPGDAARARRAGSSSAPRGWASCY